MNARAGHEWIGTWDTEAPLTQEQYHADQKFLDQIHVPDGVTLREMSVWVNGREYHWRRFDVTRLGR